MKTIARAFPDAVLAFCTLRRKLEDDEICEITKIARAGRKDWRIEKPKNPVLILTGNEILGDFGVPHCWRDMGYPQFQNSYALFDICDATQQIYLGLPGWEQERLAKYEELRKKRLGRR